MSKDPINIFLIALLVIFTFMFLSLHFANPITEFDLKRAFHLSIILGASIISLGLYNKK